MLTFSQLIERVSNPSRYIGVEVNALHKELNSAMLHCCLAFPDKYDIGSSHSGLKLLYSHVNRSPDIYAERVYAPDLDLLELLREHRIALPSLESKTPLCSFDVLGFSLQFELSYTTLLAMLDAGHIPLLRSERTEEHPVILAGGPVAFNPEPLADIIDIFVIGDAELLLPELLEVLRLAQKEERISRAGSLRLLYALAYGKNGILAEKNEQELYRFLQETYTPVKLKGLYFPGFSMVKTDKSGTYQGITHSDGTSLVVEKALVPDLNEVPLPADMVIPVGQSVHNRVSIEVDRGCTQGCRYCQAGYIYRPVRERSPEDVAESLKEIAGCTGYDAFTLLSLSLGDYHGLSALGDELADSVQRENLSLSFPSLRTGTLGSLIKVEGKRKSSSFTITIEAGSERLRRVINKKITEKEIFETVEEIITSGYTKLKIYTMVGLPGETREDIDAIAAIAIRIQKHAQTITKRGFLTINLGVSPFVPKAHTPFQWSAQLRPDAVWECIDRIKEKIRKYREIKVRWQNPQQSFIEGIFSRSGRFITPLLLNAYKKGCIFDAWQEHFDIRKWQEAIEETEGITEWCDEFLFSELPEGTVFPFEHIDTGLTKEFFRKEYRMALKEKLLPDCREEDLCFACGIDPCHKNLVPHERGATTREVAETARLPANLPPPCEQHFRIAFTRLGDVRYLSQHEMVDVFVRLFRRTGLSLAYSKGFHPHPKISFATAALPVGMESEREEGLVRLEVKHPLNSAEAEEIRRNLNSNTIKGITFSEFTPLKEHERKNAYTKQARITYLLSFTGDAEECSHIQTVTEELNSLESIPLQKGGRKPKEMDFKADCLGELIPFSSPEENYKEFQVQLSLAAERNSFWIIRGMAKEIATKAGLTVYPARYLKCFI